MACFSQVCVRRGGQLVRLSAVSVLGENGLSLSRLCSGTRMICLSVVFVHIGGLLMSVFVGVSVQECPQLMP